MLITEFLNTYPYDWQEILNQPPYCLNIKNDGDYWLFKYNVIESDMSLPLVQEARGFIVRYDEELQQYITVSHPFNKFFNYGEDNAAVINWENSKVLQKIDGSCIQVWYDRDEWHMSTLGTIDAAKAMAANGISFYDLVDGVISFSELCAELVPGYTYIFELTTPYNRIVVDYGNNGKLWYLGCRNLKTDKEEDSVPALPSCVAAPTYFPYINNLAILQRLIEVMGKDEEGYVVVDRNWNRIKIRGREYLILHKIRGNGPLTTRRIIEMIWDERIDDFVDNFPQYKEICYNVKAIITELINELDYEFDNAVLNSSSRKLLAFNTQHLNPFIRDYIFAKLDNKIESSIEWLKNYSTKKLAEYINKELNIKEIELEIEDEG